MTANQSTCLLILGMHRSGTSCLAGSLEEAGVYLGDVYRHNPFNKKGNCESQQVMALNEDLLRYNHITWDAPFLEKRINWTVDHEKQGSDILNELSRRAEANNSSVWGFKDPRTLITLPFWESGIKKLGDTILQKVATFRHPLSVSESLKNRNNFSEEKSLKLWLYYNSLLFDLYKKSPFKIINFDVGSADYKKEINDFCKLVGLNADRLNQSFYDADLKHWQYNAKLSDVPAESLQLYNELLLTSGKSV